MPDDKKRVAKLKYHDDPSIVKVKARGDGMLPTLKNTDDTGAPFILATPHHSMAWASGAAEPKAPPTAANYEAAIAQYDAALSSIEQATRDAYDQLKALDAQKVQLTEARAAMVKECKGMKKIRKSPARQL